jgi:hypothetical protein
MNYVELRALEKLRRGHALWLRFRSVYLVVGLMAVIVGVVSARQQINGLAQALQSSQPPNAFDIFLASMTSYGVTLAFIGSCLGVVIAVRAVVLWHGAPATILLLAVLESHHLPGVGEPDQGGDGAV